MPLTAHELRVLRIAAITGSSLSSVAGLFMLYWFLKLKDKSFRHQLVMLLVAADFLKALAEFIYPSATLASGDSSNGPLCTSTGFISGVFITAGDAAILIIALHAALCIFNSSSSESSHRSGLYRWRHTAYVSSAIYSIVMPSLAFLNKGPAYVSAGSWCFLPIRPFYWRIALSWAPRYFILLLIVIIYISIFIYVKWKFNTFSKMFATSGIDEDTSHNSQSVSDEVHYYEHDIVTPELPRLKTHGLVTSEPSSPGPGLHFPAAAAVSDTATVSSTPLSLDDSYINYVPASRRHSMASARFSSSRRPTIADLGKTFYPSRDTSSPATTPSDLEAGPEAVKAVDPLRLERARISKQLNHLFVYPIIYFLMWIIPFCFHMTQYSDKFARHPVIGLATLTAFVIPLHGFIDVLVYARNEKPWKSWRFRVKLPLPRNTTLTSSSGEDTIGEAGRGGVNDEVARRHLQEIQEAEEKRNKRISNPASLTVTASKDWWDTEIGSLHEKDET